jgi:hypothetical protein
LTVTNPVPPNAAAPAMPRMIHATTNRQIARKIFVAVPRIGLLYRVQPQRMVVEITILPAFACSPTDAGLHAMVFDKLRCSDS